MYDPPASFTFEPPSYRAASALTLSCEVEGVTSGLLYEWISVCAGNCFTRGKFSGRVSTPYLHSYDTGVHTCMVYDAQGYSGSASITVNVVGEVIRSTGEAKGSSASFFSTYLVCSDKFVPMDFIERLSFLRTKEVPA